MGHKGVSKRKPKKSKPSSTAQISGFSNARPGESPTIQSLVKDQGVPLNKGAMNPSAGPKNKKNKKGR